MGEIGSGSLEGLRLVEESGPEMQTGTEGCSRIGRDGKGGEEVGCQMFDVGIVVSEHLLEDSKAVKTGYTGDNSLGAGMMLSASPNGNVASLDVENHNGTGVCIGNVHGFQGEEKTGTLDTELASTVEIPSAGMNNEGCDFPCLSPLRTLTGDELGNCLRMDATLGICDTNLRADDKDCKECEDSTDRPLELVVDHALVNEQADIFLSVSAVPSTTLETGWMDGRCKGTIFFESKHPSFKMNGTDLVDSIEENQLFCMDNSGVVLSNNSVAVEEQKVAGPCSLACEFYGTTQEAYQGEIHAVSESCSLTCEQSDKVPCSAEVEFASQCLSTLADYHTFEQFTGCDTSKDDGVAVRCSQALSSSVGVSCDQSDNSRTGNVKADPILFYRRSNPKRVASLRNTSSVSKPNQSASTKHVRKSKKVVKDSTSLFNISFWNSLRMASRKKSSHRMGRASAWGTVENLYAMFSHTDGVSNCDTELNLTKREIRKARCGTGRRQSKSQKGGREKEVTCAATVDSLDLIEPRSPHFILPTSSTCPTECLPLNNTQTKTDFSVDGCSPMQFPHHHGNLEDPPTSLERNVRHGEKDLESSVTQETSFENNTGDLPGVSSHLGYDALVELSDDKLVNYPSTSPESDVIHPTTDVGIIISDFVTSTSRTSSNTPSTTQNDCIPNSGVQDNTHPDVYNVLNVTMFQNSPGLQQCAKHKNEKTIRIQESSCPSSGFFNEEKNADDLVCQYKARKPARRCKSEKKVRPGSDRQNPGNGKGRRKSSKKGLNQMEILAEKPSLGEADLLCHGETLNVQPDEKKLVSTEKDAETDVASKVTIAGEGKCTPALTASSSTKKGAEGRKKKGTNSFTKKKTKKKELLGHLVVEKEGEVLASCLEENGAPTLRLQSGDAHPWSGMAELNDLNLSKNNMLGDLGGDGGGSEIPSQKLLNSGIALPRDAEVLENSLGFESECLPPEVGWVCCDVCNKWRSLPSKLVDIIKETNCKWTCKDNNDKAFADCLIPQEKTNAEINAELEISDVSGEDNFHSAQPNSKRSDPAKRSATKQSSWKRIKSNLFLHRNRKTQNIDEVMVCFCKPPSDGSLGCGDGCLNRMLNIECVRGTCPCGDLCSNQQFQKRKYAKLKWFPCGKKGYGLQLLEKVSEGEFLIEYVGEVLDMATYEARQKEYASRGQRHFYFMTLNGSEVIDACVKGNLGRFINHSCEPNCRTEKWMVNGEICIGLFAIRDIKKGEELTFDYNYVRVFGAAAKKCICGSAECRGYIGGDPLNSDHIVLDDSDEEYLEPKMASEDPQKEVCMDRMNLDTVDISAKQPEDCEIKPDIGESMQDVVDVISIQHKETSPHHTDTMIMKPKLETTLEAVGGNCGSSPGVQQLEDSLQVPNITSKIVADAIVDAKSNLTIMTNEDNLHSPKPCASKKSSVPNGPVKKVRAGVTKFVSEKAKNILGGSCQSNNFDEVTKKLKELIGADGGISRRKDAAKAYLKLLVVTAADNIRTETIQSQSTRDLSLILDALLKTKSRAVLTDILNKNGLQMLHNIMKQNGKNSNKIPILRKLLKVLKYLVESKILTQEQINMIPSCAGVESFQDSIIRLTYHSDKEVHHAAREFREKWILRATRKANLSEMDSGHGSYDSHHTKSRWSLPSSKRSRHQVARDDDAISCAAQTVHPPSAYFGFGAASETSAPSQESTNAIPSVHANLTIGTKPRKRKSRWDQDKPPEKIKLDRQCLGSTGNIIAEASLELPKPDYTFQHENHSESGGLACSTHGAANKHGSGQQDIDETPPGFGSPPWYTSFNSRCRQSDCGMPAVNGEVVVGKRQERYLSQLAVSHGIPLGLMQQLGTPVEDGKNNCFLRWIVAPGMPFHPFPPLPPYPREKKKSNDSPTECSSLAFNRSMMASGCTGRSHSNRQYTAPYRSHVSRGIPCEVAKSVAANLENNERGRQSSDVRERKLFMPQQSCIRGHKRSIPSWPRERSGYGSKGNRRHEMCNIDQGSLRKKIGASEGAIIGDAGTTSHQQKTHN